jgi:hypothetical protein
MSSNTSSSNLTSAFVDLATYDEPEKYMYGGNDAVSYFIKKVRKATWFSIAPTILSYSSGNPGFGQAWGHKLSRAGDYLLRTWLRVSIPQVTLNLPAGGAGAVVNGTSVVYGNAALRWTRNLGHNLIQEINLSFNDLVAERMDNYFLDFWAGFTVPAGKLNAYNNMIGNIPDLIDPLSVKPLAAAKVLPSAILNIPLPFFYARDTGIALPTAAIPYNDMVHYITFRDLPNLLIIDDAVNSVSVPCPYSAVTLSGQLQCDMWAEYAIVSNIERSQMGKAPRDMLIEQVQRAPLVVFNPTANANIDIRFAHSIKALFFAVRNKTNQAEWSNYTCAQPVPSVGGCNFYPSLASDPIFQTSLYYENTARLVNMGSDYFSLVVPFYNAISVPKETGYHMISYSLDLINTNPMGSTNYGKLTNVSFQFGASNDAVTASTLGGVANALAGAPVNQSYEVVIMGMNHNIVRVSGGAKINSIKSY